MIRNRRADTGIEWTKRIVETIPIEFTQEERELYRCDYSLKEEGDWYTIQVIFSHDFAARSMQQPGSSILYT